MNNVVTFQDLLNMPSKKHYEPLDYRCFDYWNYFDSELSSYDKQRMINEGRIETKYIKCHCYDGRRTWELGYITFDAKPAFFFYAYGRDGYGKAIMDESNTYELTKYIKSLVHFEDYEIDKIYSLDDDATWITEFYGQSLFGEFG